MTTWSCRTWVYSCFTHSTLYRDLRKHNSISWEWVTLFFSTQIVFQDPRVKVAQKPCSLCQCSKRSFPQLRRLWSRRLISESSMSVVWRSQSLYNLLGRHFQPKGQIASAREANLAMLFSIFSPKNCHLLILIEDDNQ